MQSKYQIGDILAFNGDVLCHLLVENITFNIYLNNKWTTYHARILEENNTVDLDGEKTEKATFVYKVA